MWFERGAMVGLAGRLLAGAEMLVMYIIIALAVVTLVYQRNDLRVWLLFAWACLGCIALGYVVVNISTLYRMRYVFFILLIILGVQGFRIILSRRIRSGVILVDEPTRSI
jgi:hypothetical protein